MHLFTVMWTIFDLS